MIRHDLQLPKWARFINPPLPLLEFRTTYDETIGSALYDIDEVKICKKRRLLHDIGKHDRRLLPAIGQAEVERLNYEVGSRLVVRALSFNTAKVNQRDLLRYHTSALNRLAHLCLTEKRSLTPDGEVIPVVTEIVGQSQGQGYPLIIARLQAATVWGEGIIPRTEPDGPVVSEIQFPKRPTSIS